MTGLFKLFEKAGKGKPYILSLVVCSAMLTQNSIGSQNSLHLIWEAVLQLVRDDLHRLNSTHSPMRKS